MKTIFFLMLFSAISAKAEMNFVGEYHFAHEVDAMGYEENTCNEAAGTWRGDSVCVFTTNDTVKITKTPETNSKTFTASISTIATNFNACSFEGTFTMIENYRLVSVTRPEGEEKPACKIIIRTLPPTRNESVEVTTMGDGCRFYCGANAGLSIGKANRVSQ